MTPEEHRDLDARVATQVMEWRADTLEIYGNEVVYWYTQSGHRAWYTDAFCPSTDIVAAWQVREQVKTWLFSKRLSFTKHLRTCISQRLGLGDDLISYLEVALHMEPVDICMAALRAVGDT